MNIANLLVRGCQRGPDRPAIAEGRRVVATYGSLRTSVPRLATGMAARGVGLGDRVALFLGNCPATIELMLAAWWLGAVIVPINAKLARPELDVILKQAAPKLLFVGPDTADVAAGRPAVDVVSAEFVALKAGATGPGDASVSLEPATVSGGDLAWLFFTSGTTGAPKGAMITHANLLSMAQGYLTDVDPIPAASALIHFAPLSHGSGIYLLPFLSAGAVSVCGESPRMTVAELFELIGHWPNASMFAAPTIVQRMTQAMLAARAAGTAPDLGNLRTVVYGGGPLYPSDLQAAARVFGPAFAQIYGQGESPMTITAQSRADFSRALAAGDQAYLATVGQPFLGTEVAIADANGHRVPIGAIGEILVRSQTVVSGYWQQPDATAATIKDGWLWTGDLGRLDARGCLTLEGRSKETIISGGSNVYPIEVETVLLNHPAVVEAAVVGEVDPEWGERVVAYVVLSDALEEGAARSVLDAHCRAAIARFKCPKVYVVCDALPKNAYGKVAKRELRRAD